MHLWVASHFWPVLHAPQDLGHSLMKPHSAPWSAQQLLAESLPTVSLVASVEMPSAAVSVAVVVSVALDVFDVDELPQALRASRTVQENAAKTLQNFMKHSDLRCLKQGGLDRQRVPSIVTSRFMVKDLAEVRRP